MMVSDVFDAAKPPHMKFTSTKFGRRDSTLEIAGNLANRGVTRPAVLTIVSPPTEPVKDPWGNLRVGATATWTVAASWWATTSASRSTSSS